MVTVVMIRAATARPAMLRMVIHRPATAIRVLQAGTAMIRPATAIRKVQDATAMIREIIHRQVMTRPATTIREVQIRHKMARAVTTRVIFLISNDRIRYLKGC